MSATQKPVMTRAYPKWTYCKITAYARQAGRPPWLPVPHRRSLWVQGAIEYGRGDMRRGGVYAGLTALAAGRRGCRDAVVAKGFLDAGVAGRRFWASPNPATRPAASIMPRACDGCCDRVLYSVAARRPPGSGGNVIRVLVAEDMRILRDTLVAVLNLEDDIDVVAQVADGQGDRVGGGGGPPGCGGGGY